MAAQQGRDVAEPDVRGDRVVTAGQRQLEDELGQPVRARDVRQRPPAGQRPERGAADREEALGELVGGHAGAAGAGDDGGARAAQARGEVTRTRVEVLEHGVDRRPEVGAAGQAGHRGHRVPGVRLAPAAGAGPAVAVVGRSASHSASASTSAPPAVSPGVSSSSRPGSGSLPTPGPERSSPCAAAVSEEYEVRRHARSSARSKVRTRSGPPAPSPAGQLGRLAVGVEQLDPHVRTEVARRPRVAQLERVVRLGHPAARAQHPLQGRGRRGVRGRPPRHDLALRPGEGDVEQPQVLGRLLGLAPGEAGRPARRPAPRRRRARARRGRRRPARRGAAAGSRPCRRRPSGRPRRGGRRSGTAGPCCGAPSRR